MADIPYHTHTFDLPDATPEEVAEATETGKVVTPASLVGVSAHLQDLDNPHEVTAAQVGTLDAAEIAAALALLVSVEAQTLEASQKRTARANIAATGNLLRIVRITSSTTYNKSSDARKIFVRGIGGGPGGGGADASGSVARVGSGGSAGTYGEKMIDDPDDSYEVIIGAAGLGGSGSGGTDGQSGGTSSFGSVLTLPGGIGGPGSGTDTAAPGIRFLSGLAPAATGADRSIRGACGFPGLRLDATVRLSGMGASSPFGSGGPPGRSQATSSVLTGESAVGYGTGGGGGLSSTTVAANGGPGAPGYFEIWEFG